MRAAAEKRIPCLGIVADGSDWNWRLEQPLNDRQKIFGRPVLAQELVGSRVQGGNVIALVLASRQNQNRDHTQTDVFLDPLADVESRFVTKMLIEKNKIRRLLKTEIDGLLRRARMTNRMASPFEQSLVGDGLRATVFD